MTGTSEGRIAEALERIDGNLGRIADVLEEGGLNDIADAFTIIAMAITGMEPELEDEDLPEH
ncbi:MAG: alkaline phosphatase family protein [Boseongicola sp. SB0677_bin_26]|nr:alkaline phosphatase family protein [Boseongicola sp. SB0665_bin_10]MYG28697.1 alkaline phosphatase family protein [Boseongicola sp. SB0677_bin_26]